MRCGLRLLMVCLWLAATSSAARPFIAPYIPPALREFIEKFSYTVDVASPPPDLLKILNNLTLFRSQLDGIGSARPPILLIPPLTGVQLDLKLDNRPSPPHWWCRRWQPWTLAWLNPFELLPGWFDCFVENIKQRCAPDGRCTAPPGTMVRPRPGFDSAMYVLPWGGAGFSVFGPLAKALEDLGWERGKTLIAHLYDWRLSPLSHLDQPSSGHGMNAYEALKHNVERAVSAAHGRKALLIAVSMGAPHSTLFLNEYVDAAWKAQHVGGFISISGVWGGAPAAAIGLISGVWGKERRPSSAVKDSPALGLFRGLPVLSWLLPTHDAYDNTTIIVENVALRKQYPPNDIGSALEDAGVQQAEWVRAAIARRLTGSSAGAPGADPTVHPPDIPTWCFIGTHVPTPIGAVYHDREFRSCILQYGSGDGTVPFQALEICPRWTGKQIPPVEVKRYPAVSHAQVLGNALAFKDVLSTVVTYAQHDSFVS